MGGAAGPAHPLGAAVTLRDTILRLLHSKSSAAATPRHMAMWFGFPVAEVRAELARLQAEGIAGPLPSRRGKERIWVLTENL